MPEESSVTRIPLEFLGVELEQVLSGEELYMRIPLAFGIWTSQRMRLRNYAAPRLIKGEFSMGQAALLRLENVCEYVIRDAIPVKVRVHPLPDGRYVCDLFLQLLEEEGGDSFEWVNVAECLVKEGWGVAWREGEHPKFDEATYPPLLAGMKPDALDGV